MARDPRKVIDTIERMAALGYIIIEERTPGNSAFKLKLTAKGRAAGILLAQQKGQDDLVRQLERFDVK